MRTAASSAVAIESGFPALARITHDNANTTWKEVLASPDVRRQVLETLSSEGAVILRGALLEGGNHADELSSTVQQILDLNGEELGSILSRSQRYEIQHGVKLVLTKKHQLGTTTPDATRVEAPPGERMRRVHWHQELTYMPRGRNVDALALAASQAPQSGGPTYLMRVSDFWAAVREPLRSRLQNGGNVTYEVVFPSAAGALPTWQDAFDTADRIDATRRCDEFGWAPRWTADDELVATIRRPLFRRHPLTGELLWHNSLGAAQLWLKHPLARVSLSNGDQIGASELAELHDVFGRLETRGAMVYWAEHANDILLIDNFKSMHAAPSVHAGDVWTGGRSVLNANGRYRDIRTTRECV